MSLMRLEEPLRLFLMAQTGAALQTELSSPEFRSVPPDQVEAIWPTLEPMIKRGLAHGQGDGTTSDHMKWAVQRGASLLWVVKRGEEFIAGVVLAVREQDTGRKLWVDMLAGIDADEWGDQLMDLLRDYKSITGCRCIEASCRSGLARKLQRRGWRKKAVVMELI